jgi:hypothetical protein
MEVKGRGFEGCMIQLFRWENGYHVSTATTVGGPGWLSITSHLVTRNTVCCRDRVKFPRSFGEEDFSKVPHSQIAEPSARAVFL